MSEFIFTNPGSYPRVLVVTADGISADWLLGTSEITHDSPLVQLDLNTACFEQFFLQKVVADDVWSTLGDFHHWTSFLNRLHSFNSSVALCKSSDTKDWPVLPDEQCALRTDDLSLPPCDVCWIHVPTILDRDDNTGRLLKRLHELRQSCEAAGNHPCSLLVFPLRGNSFVPQPPMESGFPEAECHVPLWIDAGQRHVFRVQQLAGSFDLFSTLISLVQLSRSGRFAPTGEANAGEADVGESTASPEHGIDLSPWLKNPGVRLNRTILVDVSGARAEISEDSLSVVKQDQHGDKVFTRFGRPEDPWSVNPVVDV